MVTPAGFGSAEPRRASGLSIPSSGFIDPSCFARRFSDPGLAARGSPAPGGTCACTLAGLKRGTSDPPNDPATTPGPVAASATPPATSANADARAECCAFISAECLFFSREPGPP